MQSHRYSNRIGLYLLHLVWKFMRGKFEILSNNFSFRLFFQIERERGGEQIDHGLIKQVLGVFLEVGGVNNMEPYENDFEAHMLENTASYYSRKASNHIYIDSFLEYMLMVCPFFKLSVLIKKKNLCGPLNEIMLNFPLWYFVGRGVSEK